MDENHNRTFMNAYPKLDKKVLTPNEKLLYSLFFEDQRQEILRQQIVIHGLRAEIAELKLAAQEQAENAL
jgi:hypothetical protein